MILSLSAFGDDYGGELSHSDLVFEPGAIRIIEENEQLQVDIFTCMDGVPYTELIERAETSTVAGRPFRYASKLQLIRFKSASTREKDRIDVSALKQLLRDPHAFD